MLKTSERRLNDRIKGYKRLNEEFNYEQDKMVMSKKKSISIHYDY